MGKEGLLSITKTPMPLKFIEWLNNSITRANNLYLNESAIRVSEPVLKQDREIWLL